jgi:LuxR family maltose regulon positive regulatory protein
LGLHLAWLSIVGGRIGPAVGLLKAIERGYGPNSTPRWVRTVASLGRAFLAAPGGNEPLPDYSLLEEIPDDVPILQNAADYLYAMTLGRRGELDRAVEAAIMCIQREKAGAVPSLAPFLSRITLILGRLHAAHDLCREHIVQNKEQEAPLVHAAGSMKIDLGEVLYEWDQLEGAEAMVRAGLRENETWGNIMTEGFGLAALTRLLVAKGDYAEAMQTFKQFETRLRGRSTPREFEEDLRTLGARLQLASGDLQGASRWADQVQQSDGFESRKELYRLTLARIRLAQGKAAEVERLLAGTTPPVAAGSQISRQIETNLLLAAAVYKQDRPHEATALVEKSLHLAEPEGYVRVFLDHGDAVQSLLADYLRSEAPRHRSYAQKLQAAFTASSGSGPDRSKPAGLIEALTTRELEVLHLLAQGMTNKAIAGQLFVAPGTVKAHAASIYRKLEAANRTEAVARARQLGVLS